MEYPINYPLSRISAGQIIPENLLLYEPEKRTAIFQVEIDPIDYCNHKCQWCFTFDFRHDKKIPPADLRRYLNSFYDSGGKSVVFSGGGEPLLYKEIYSQCDIFDKKSICNFLIEKSIYIGIITNGLLLSKLFLSDFNIIDLSFIRISLDATDEVAHAKLHQTVNTDFNRIITSIQKLIEIRGGAHTPAIGISFIVDSFNGINSDMKQIAKINELACKLKVDFVQFKHIHTVQKEIAISSMQTVHTHCGKLDWSDVEYWVQTYDSANDSKSCLISQYIQSIGSDSKRFPCCHLFGKEEFLDQTDFLPQGKTITNCNNKVCRYNEMNQILLNDVVSNYKVYKSVLEKSLQEFGFHPFRYCPTAPTILKPFKSKNAEILRH